MAGRRGRAEAARELVVAGTPSIVVYRVTTVVEILAVVHTARDGPESFAPTGCDLTIGRRDAAPRIGGA